MISQKRRSIKAPPVEIGNIELSIIRALHHYRLLEWRQLQQLFCSAKHDASFLAQRIELLYRNAYIEDIPRPIYPFEASKGIVYRLGPVGATLLSGQLSIPFPDFSYWGKGDDKDRRKTQVSSLFLEHAIALTDIRIAFERSAAHHNCHFDCWEDDVAIRRARQWPRIPVEVTPGKEEVIPILPDGYFVLTSPYGHGHFFLECDRSTESINRRWRRKILGYKEFVLSGEFNRRYHVDGNTAPLRIVTTTPSLARAQNLMQAAETYGLAEARTLFLFTPLSDLLAQDALSAPIWLRAGSSSRQSIF